MPLSWTRLNILTFLHNYVEKNVLPSRIPGYKHDDLQLLRSNITKKVPNRATLKKRFSKRECNGEMTLQLSALYE